MKHTITKLASNGPFDTMTEYKFSDGSRYVEILTPTETGGYRTKVLYSEFEGDRERRSTRHDLDEACKDSTRVESFDAPDAENLPEVGAVIVHKDGTEFEFIALSKDQKTYRVRNVETGKRGYVRITNFQ